MEEKSTGSVLPPPRVHPAPPSPRPRRRRRLILFLAALSLVILGGYGIYRLAPWPDSEPLLRRAAEEIDHYLLGKALADLSEYLRAHPNDAAGHFLMARTARRARDLARAKEHLDEARRLRHPDDQVELESALLQAQSGRLGSVALTLQAYVDGRHPDERLILEALADSCLHYGGPDEAHRWCSLWQERFPDDWLAYLWNGRVYEKRSKNAEAAREFQRALDRKPGSVVAHLALGGVLLGVGQFREAVPHYQAFLEQNPDDPVGLLGLARCQRSLEPPGVTRATVRRLLTLYPRHAGGLLLLGQVELDCANLEEGLALLLRAEQANPQDRDTLQSLARACRLLGRENRARDYLARSEQIEKDKRRMEQIMDEDARDPGNTARCLEAGTILRRQGALRQAVDWLARALEIDPGNAPARKALRECLGQLDDPRLTEYFDPLIRDGR